MHGGMGVPAHLLNRAVRAGCRLLLQLPPPLLACGVGVRAHRHLPGTDKWEAWMDAWMAADKDSDDGKQALGARPT